MGKYAGGDVGSVGGVADFVGTFNRKRKPLADEKGQPQVDVGSSSVVPCCPFAKGSPAIQRRRFAEPDSKFEKGAVVGFRFFEIPDDPDAYVVK